MEVRHFSDSYLLFETVSIAIKIDFSGLVDQDALIKALQEKRIGGAGLDVMTPEPLPLDNPLTKMDNVGMINKYAVYMCVYANDCIHIHKCYYYALINWVFNAVLNVNVNTLPTS